VNKELPPKSSLNLTLIQHPRDEDPEPREVRIRLKVESLPAWYYCISPNSRTLVILLQIDFAFSDELEIIYESCYKTKDISIPA
jgi:hypothetical protein